MQDEKQYEQLILQYTQLKNGAEDIARMIESEDYDSAITMLKSREPIFTNCKNMRRYLELTPVQQKEVDSLVEEIKDLEMQNIIKLEKGLDEVKTELVKAQKNQKIQQAYDVDIDAPGSIINIEE
ncbi:flagellar protein FliT [bacterium]|nr:flagellar protein FliT [bacterium]